MLGDGVIVNSLLTTMVQKVGKALFRYKALGAGARLTAATDTEISEGT